MQGKNVQKFMRTICWICWFQGFGIANIA